MGLAASQARLLTITARKSDCEFQSMRLSHEKIALARNMEHISDEYQDALGKTKLVYDYYGSGTGQQELNYNLLMRPSVYNDYYPKLLTDKTNRVVLDSKYAAAAAAAGIPVEGLQGTPSDAVRNKFIQYLAGSDVISLQTAASIQSVTYGNTIGLGTTFSITSATQEVTWASLASLFAANDVGSKAYGLKFGQKDEDTAIIYDGKHSENEYARLYTTKSGFDEGAGLGETAVNFTIWDLLNGTEQYNLAARSADYGGVMTPIVEAALLQRMVVGKGEQDNSFLNYMLEVFSSVLGGTPANDKALQYAYDQMYNMLYPNNDLQDAAAYRSGDYFNNHDNPWHDMDESTELKDIDPATGKSFGDILMYFGTSNGNADDDNGSWSKVSVQAKDSQNFIGFTYGASNKGDDDDGNDHSWVAINLNNIAKSFLTAYVEYLQGVGSTNYSYSKGKINSNTKLYTPKDTDTFVVGASSDINMGNENLAAGFYDAMFNIICTQGWVRNDQINDPSYMHEQMKNGTLFISSISNDGYYYQSTYNTDKYIVEVADQDAIAQAEAKYNSEKAKIQSKEDTLDVKMKNLDTEISSLTTEYDTTKNIINKAIEKSFKRYEA